MQAVVANERSLFLLTCSEFCFADITDGCYWIKIYPFRIVDFETAGLICGSNYSSVASVPTEKVYHEIMEEGRLAMKRLKTGWDWMGIWTAMTIDPTVTIASSGYQQTCAFGLLLLQSFRVMVFKQGSAATWCTI